MSRTASSAHRPRARRRSDAAPEWRVTVDVSTSDAPPRRGDASRIAEMFGLAGSSERTLYEALRVELGRGQVTVVVGPSGAGKSVLLRSIRRQVSGAIALRPDRLARSRRRAVDLVGAASGGSGLPLRRRLEVLSRCGLADAAALVTPVNRLSGGQLYRLALADAFCRAMASGRPKLVVADEFAAVLDDDTAAVLCLRVRKLIRSSQGMLSLVAATPRAEAARLLRPDRVIVKPLGAPARIVTPKAGGSGRRGDGRDPARPGCWPVEQGRIADYRALERFHYIAGPPACHKRVYVIRPPDAGPLTGAPRIAAVCVVSPPLLNCRGRNAALPGRYTGSNRREAVARLNAEIEAVSRVIVHPVYRGCGLAVRLARHALVTARTPLVEALAVMGRVHPFFEKAGMYPYGCFDGRRRYAYYLAHRCPPIRR